MLKKLLSRNVTTQNLIHAQCTIVIAVEGLELLHQLFLLLACLNLRHDEDLYGSTPLACTIEVGEVFQHPCADWLLGGLAHNPRVIHSLLNCDTILGLIGEHPLDQIFRFRGDLIPILRYFITL